MCVDISGEPANNWFDLQIDATYWNAFNHDDKAWAALPLLYGAQRATFAIQFPAAKPPTIWDRHEGSRDTKDSELVTDDSVKVENHDHILWTIQHPRRNWVYKIEWNW